MPSSHKDTLRLFATFPQTSLIIFGGAAHDAGYTPMLSALKTDGLIHKVLLLKTYSDMAFEIYQLDLPAMCVAVMVSAHFLSRLTRLLQ